MRGTQCNQPGILDRLECILLCTHTQTIVRRLLLYYFYSIQILLKNRLFCWDSGSHVTSDGVLAIFYVEKARLVKAEQQHKGSTANNEWTTCQSLFGIGPWMRLFMVVVVAMMLVMRMG